MMETLCRIDEDFERRFEVSEDLNLYRVYLMNERGQETQR